MPPYDVELNLLLLKKQTSFAYLNTKQNGVKSM